MKSPGLVTHPMHESSPRARHARTRALLLLAALLAAASPAAAQPAEPLPAPAEATLPAPAQPLSDGAQPAPAQPAAAVQPAAATQPAPALGEPRIHHGPVSVAQAGHDVHIRAEIEEPHRIKRAILYVSAPNASSPREVLFQRAPTGPYVAVVPGLDVRPPGFAYAIELELVDGTRVAAFATRARPFRVAVPPDLEDARERALLTRLDGRRSVVSASGEYVLFGRTAATVVDPDTGLTEQRDIRDQYYRVESGYTYRPLGTVAEFSIRIGVVRGRSVVPGETDADKFDVGLNYGSPSVRFRLADQFHLETELLTSVTEVGFSVGAGGALLVGDVYGSHLTFGVESVQTFGTRFFSRMTISAGDSLQVTPIIEVTDMPHADRFGVRLLTEVGTSLGSGVHLAARGGYQARTFTSGGPSAAAIVSYAF